MTAIQAQILVNCDRIEQIALLTSATPWRLARNLQLAREAGQLIDDTARLILSWRLAAPR